MTEYSDFKSLFHDKMRERGLTLKRLSELSGIAIQHLEALSKEEVRKLPAAPYLRGYLERLGGILDFNPAVWREYFGAQGAVLSSGAADELPRNRFARQPAAKYLWLIIIALLVVFYLSFRFQDIFGRPVITVSYPRETMISVRSGAITVSGALRGSSQVLINGEAIPVGADGGWEKRLTLEPGLNTIEMRAKKLLGGETRVIRQIIYEPASELPTSTPTTTLPQL